MRRPTVYLWLWLAMVVYVAVCGVTSETASAGPDCVDGASRLGKCNSHCTCIEGKWRCCRVRYEVNRMSKSDRKRFYQTLHKAMTDRRWRARFLEIANYHTLLSPAYLHFFPRFFPWHRWHLVELETLLRKIDCRVSVPYWDLGIGWRDFSVLPMWSADACGGNGTGEDHCVTNGLWGYPNYTLPKAMKNGSCLQRNLAKNLVSWRVIQQLLSVSHGNPHLEWATSLAIHNYVHCRISGTMATLCSSMDPVFWSLHSAIDKIWSTFQLGRENLSAWEDNEIPLMGSVGALTSQDMLNNLNLPNGVCVYYAASLPHRVAVGKKYYFALPVPRDSHFHPNLNGELSATTLSSAEVAQLEVLVFYMEEMLKAPGVILKALQLKPSTWKSNRHLWKKLMAEQRQHGVDFSAVNPLRCKFLFPPTWQRCII